MLELLKKSHDKATQDVIELEARYTELSKKFPHNAELLNAASSSLELARSYSRGLFDAMKVVAEYDPSNDEQE